MMQPQAPAATVVCILGMHRSGTSALARLVNVLGVALGPDLLEARVDNPRGFWENRRILEAHADLLEAAGSFFDDILPLEEGWERRPEMLPYRQRLLDIIRDQFSDQPLWGFKDPRTCRLLPLWKDLFTQLNVAPRYVLMTRHPDEIARSLAVRSGYAYNKSLLMTLTHLLEAEHHTRGSQRAVVTYEQVLGDWPAVADRLSAQLHVPWLNASDATCELGEFLDPGLRHHHAMEKVGADEMIALRGADESIARWTCRVHQLLNEAAGTSGVINEQAMDEVRSGFRADLKRLTGWRPLRSIDQQFMKIEAWGQRLDAAVKLLTTENQQLKESIARQQDDGPAIAGGDGAPPSAMAAGSAMQDEMEVLHRELARRDEAIAELQTRQRQVEISNRWRQDSAGSETEVERLIRCNRELEAGRAWLTDENSRLSQRLRNYERQTKSISDS